MYTQTYTSNFNVKKTEEHMNEQWCTRHVQSEALREQITAITGPADINVISWFCDARSQGLMG